MPRSIRAMRRVRPLQLAAGALLLTLPGTAYALGPSAPEQPQIAPSAVARTVRFGRALTISGRLPDAAQDTVVALQLAPAQSTRFATITSAPLGAGGRFALRARPRESGLLRVLATDARQASGQPAYSASAPVRVTVDARLATRARTLDLLGDRRVVVVGRLLAAHGRRTVVLAERRRGRWVALARARTGARGRFALAVPRWARSGALRVRFAGDRLNGAAVASWYWDAGQTACGFHARYGVANVSLPCGTRVTFSYRGRRVSATVDDRGPYVPGRTWDLDQSTAAALSFGGVATVYYSL